MNLVWDKYLQFLNDNGIDVNKYNLKQGYYWLDSQIIKAYDKQGNIHKILRLIVDDELSIKIKTVYNNEPFEIESWFETIERNKEKLTKIENDSKVIIASLISKYNMLTPVILSSGGKDSNIVTHLTRELKPDTEIIFNNTSLDCADTYLHIKQQDNVRIINPNEGFYQWRKKINFVGNRISRACCTIFKEGAMVDVLDENDKYLFFMGMRNEESNARSAYGDEWKNAKWGSRDWQGILPIRTWTEEEVWLYTLWRNIPINPKYKKGYARVGCAIACPYYTKSTWVLDKYWYPQQFKRWHDILDKDFIDNNKEIILNCTLKEYHTCWNGGVYRTEPTQEVIKQFADRNKFDIDVANKYFNHNCEDCGKRIKSKEVLAMNMKYNGRDTNKFFCKKCLIKKLTMTPEQWIINVESFKELGCVLF